MVREASALWCSTESGLRGFLRRPGHLHLHDRVVHVAGVLHDGATVSLYVVLVGVAGEINAGTRKAEVDDDDNIRAPNVSLVVDVGKGFSSGFVTLAVPHHHRSHLRNGQLLQDQACTH